MKRSLVALAIAASALAGAGTASAALSSASPESAWRTALQNCVLVDEAVKLGVDPAVMIPTTLGSCRALKLSLRARR